MHYVLEYDLVGDYLERRAPLRAEHLELAREASRRGELLLAGAVADPPTSALLVWSVDDPTLIERFVAADPYVRQGLVAEWRIRPWQVVVGALATE